MSTSVPVCVDGTLTAVGNLIECVGGVWEIYDGSQLPGAFDLAALDPDRLVQFLGAGFVLASSPILLAWGCKVILDMLRG